MPWLRLLVLALMPYWYTSPYWMCRRDWPVIETQVDYIVAAQGMTDTKIAFFKQDVNGVQRLQEWESANWVGQHPAKSLDGKWRFAYANTIARCYRVVVASECLDLLAEDFNWGPAAGMPPAPFPCWTYWLPRSLFRAVSRTLSNKPNGEVEWPPF